MAVPVVYVSDLTFDRFDPADLFDLAYLVRSPEHDLRAVCLPDGSDGERVLDALAVRANTSIPRRSGFSGLQSALEAVNEPVNLVVVSGYDRVASLLGEARELVREKVARLFLVGGHANDYTQGRAGERLPIDPRLMERHPEHFAPSGDLRLAADQRNGFLSLLTSGEGIIWLPRDICLWRYSAPSLLAGSGELNEFLLRELFFSHLSRFEDRYDAANASVLLSSLPALLLAVKPDPFLWMRLFRALTLRVDADPETGISHIDSKTDRPNLYGVIAIDSKALSERLTQVLRG
ncbi:MAG: hypothetical protein OHK0029_02110 [Armatimonadaceae bacterium]